MIPAKRRRRRDGKEPEDHSRGRRHCRQNLHAHRLHHWPISGNLRTNSVSGRGDWEGKL